MEIEFDPNKSKKNEDERGLPFSLVSEFEWETALFTEDNRFDYPEKRIIGLGKIEQRVHVICFTPIPNGIRVISFRKANKREVKRYENASDG